MFGAGVAVGVEPDVVPKPSPSEGAEEVAVPLVLAPAFPNRPPAGFGVSPLGFPNPLKLGVAVPPKRLLAGLLAGVVEAPPPKTLDELVAVFVVPKRPPLGAAEVVLLAVPNRLGVAPPDELVAAPNSGLLGVALLLLLVKLNDAMMLWWGVVVVERDGVVLFTVSKE